MATMRFTYDDGGREASGRRGDARDCVARAIAIATHSDYDDVYRDLSDRMEKIGRPRSARNGIPRKVYEDYLGDLGWRWFPTMRVGAGCTVHLTDELYRHAFGEPTIIYGTAFVVRLSKHLTAVVNGVIRDTHDPSRNGFRCVYGYFMRED